jgi:hypothetical protein
VTPGQGEAIARAAICKDVARPILLGKHPATRTQYYLEWLREPMDALPDLAPVRLVQPDALRRIHGTTRRALGNLVAGPLIDDS